MTDNHELIEPRLRFQLLICFHILACCISLVCVSQIYPEYHIHFSMARLPGAVGVIAAFAVVSVLFVYAEFTFGYFVGFYVYTMVTGYLWLNCFSEFSYDHRLTGLSAAASAITFLLPALYIRSPIRQLWRPSPEAFDRILNSILVLSCATIAAAATYNFRILWLSEDLYPLRDSLQLPTILRYLIGITTSALLPFAFACFVERNDFLRGVAVLILLLLLYPVTLNKLALFSSVWIAIMLASSKFLEPRKIVVASLFVPLVIGIIIIALYLSGAIPERWAIPYFWLVNFRTVAIPSMAIDYYNEFFSRHELTHFCQIGLLKRFVSCAYQEPLWTVIYRAFGIGGNFNASLFATEGIASVGPRLAPIAVFVCGLVIALGNRFSAGLPPRFVLISAAILPHVLLNVPLTITLLTHGAAILFFLWYITPRTIFERAPSSPAAAAH